MLQDIDMYYDETDTPAMARTSNLNEELGQVCKSTTWSIINISLKGSSWKAGLRIQTTYCNTIYGSLLNDVWGSSTEIPCWWCVTTQIWVVFLIGWSNCKPIRTTNQNWVVTRHQREIFEFVPQTSFYGETIGNMRNVGCFLHRLEGKTVRGL